MDDQYVHEEEGQELRQTDLNTLGEVSGLADDRVLSDLLQYWNGSGVAQKGIMPYATAFNGAANPNLFSCLVQPSEVADGYFYIFPFRALVGMRDATGVEAMRGSRSGLLVGSGALDPIELFRPDDTASNNRVDLVYAQVDIDEDNPTVTRYVKAADGSVSAQSVVTIKKTNVTIGSVKGTEAASPTRPTLPSDVAGTTYYIPLAYLWLTHPFTSSTTTAREMVEEVAPRIGINHGRTGGSDAAPFNQCYEAGSALQTNDPWSVTKRPDVYLAPSMAGTVERFIGLDQETDLTIPLSTTVLVDDSIDWRNRVFDCGVQAAAGGAKGLAWQAGPFTSGNCIPDDIKGGAPAIAEHRTFAQSFQDSTGAAGFAFIITASNTVLAPVAAGEEVKLYVDLSDGKLYAITTSGNAACKLFFWIRASGQFRLGGP